MSKLEMFNNWFNEVVYVAKDKYGFTVESRYKNDFIDLYEKGLTPEDAYVNYCLSD